MTLLLVAVVEFTDAVSVAAVVVSILGTVAALVGVVYGTRYKVGYEAAAAAAKTLRESLADERDRVTRQETQLRLANEQVTAAQTTIARLESLPDFGHVVTLLESYDVRAQERHDQAVVLLSALTDRVLKGAP